MSARYRFNDGLPPAASIAGAQLAPRWDDVLVPMNAVRLPAVSDPTWRNFFGNFWTLGFGNNNVVTFAVQLPHGIDEGDTMYWHVHWSPGSNGNQPGKFVVWELEYSIAWGQIPGKVQVFPPSDTISVTESVDVPNNSLFISEDKPIVLTDVGESAIVLGRIRRIAHPTDNAAGEMFLISSDFHCRMNKLGTTNHEYPFGGG